MWKYQRRLPVFGVAALLATTLVACTDDASDDEMSVKIKGGQAASYQLGDVTIKTSERSVPRDVELTLTRPEYMKGRTAPFAANSVQFDLSLDGGKMQPAEPLEISVPLSGGYLPPGAEAPHALLYTPAQSGKGLELIPATVSDGVLRAKLHHLSPKILTFPADSDFIEIVGRLRVQELRKDCQASAKTSGGTVHFAAGNKGWSSKPSSPVQACLSVRGSQAELTVINRVNFLMAVASTGGLKLTTAGTSNDEQMAIRLAQQIFPNRKIKTYLGREASLNAPLPTQNFPATVQLQAEPSAFLTEAAWASVKFLVGAIAAKKDDELLKAADAVLDAPGVVGCLRSALDGNNTNPSLGQVIDTVVSECADIVGKTLGAFMSYDKNAWNLFWDRFFAVVGGLKSGWDTFWTTISGIKMQFVGTVSVVVGVAAPACPSDSELIALVRRSGWSPERLRIRHMLASDKVCRGSWVLAYVQDYWEEYRIWGDPLPYVFRWEDNKWTFFDSAGTGGFTLPYDENHCAPLPSWLRSRLCH